MRTRRRVPIIIGALLAALSASLALNAILFERARAYYLDLNSMAIDPLGLRRFPPEGAGPSEGSKPLVVFFGDSRAAQWPAPARPPALRFANRGIGGQTSAQVLGRLAAHITPLRPRVLVVQVGINDLKTIPLFPERKREIIDRCKANIEEIIKRSTDQGAIVIITTIFPVGEIPIERRPLWSPDVSAAVDEVNAWIKTLASPNVIVFDSYAILAEGGKARSDVAQGSLHINATGYSALNAELTRILAALNL